jgi:hypothetical protein
LEVDEKITLLSNVILRKDMGGYIDSDYCSEEYGIEPYHDDKEIACEAEWGDVIQVWYKEHGEVLE